MRNIVLITIESLRADHCSFMGYERKTTPTLDKMAEKGLYFENAIAPGTYTSESMIHAFTGQHSYIVPDAPGFEMSPEPWRKTISSRQPLAKMLSEKGYKTIGFTPNPLTSRFYGFDKGFDYFEDFLEGKESKGPLSLISRLFKTFLPKKSEYYMPWENYYGNLMENVKSGGTPVFLWVFLLDTHEPHKPSEKNWSGLLDYRITQFEKLAEKKFGYVIEPREEKRVNLYDDTIRYADKFIEKLWNDLKDLNPIFIIHSDHGQAFGEHGIYGHTGHFYEEFNHIPLVIYNSEITGEIKNPVPLDLKLILEMIEKNDIDVLSKSWAISKAFDRDMIRTELRLGDWKFIYDREEKLYNLKKDPEEKRNRAGEFPILENYFKNIIMKDLNTDMEITRVKSLASKLANQIKGGKNEKR